MVGYRVLFGLAAIYNTAFGIWAGFFPLSFFNLFGLGEPRYPVIWSCLGMVVGVYAIAYAYAAWKPEQGDLLIAIGLIGKVLGPIGWLVAVSKGELPPRTFPLILLNDLVWWFPFLIYLLRNTRYRGAIVTWLGVGIHIVACLRLLASAEGLEWEENFGRRFTWILANARLWTITWFAWSVASMSLIAFAFVWARELFQRGGRPADLISGVRIMTYGLIFDLAGECVYIFAPSFTYPDFNYFWPVIRQYTILSVVLGNGLYCVGGLTLSVVALRVGWLTGFMAKIGFAMWGIGLFLSLAAVFNNRLAIVASGAALMTLFIPWSAWVGWRMLPRLDRGESSGV